MQLLRRMLGAYFQFIQEEEETKSIYFLILFPDEHLPHNTYNYTNNSAGDQYR